MITNHRWHGFGFAELGALKRSSVVIRAFSNHKYSFGTDCKSAPAEKQSVIRAFPNLRYRLNLFSILIISSLIFLNSCDSGESGRYKRIKTAVDKIWLVDTHEHFIPESGSIKSESDFFSLVIGYLQADMLSSGMSNDELAIMLDNKKPGEERWNIFSTYWENSKNTGYGQALQITVKGLFNVDVINEISYKEIDSKMRDTRKTEGWYDHVLKDKSHVDVSIVDPLGEYARPGTEYPPEFFVKVRRFDNFITVNPNNIRTIESQYGVKINSLSDYINALDLAFKKAVDEESIVGIKTGLAYSRKLYFEDVPEDVADQFFSKVLKSSQAPDADAGRKLQDYMFHKVVACSEKYELPFQIHTGMLSRNFRSNPIENTNALHLSNLFLKFRKAKFVIFHGSYPYMHELSYLAKHYPNVYIDMCWMHIISPAASERYLEEWLLTVPVNKILAFGGDASIEWTYGHSVMAREVVTKVLTKMVNDGYYTENEAIEIAEKILRNNAIELFRIKKTGNQWSRADS